MTRYILIGVLLVIIATLGVVALLGYQQQVNDAYIRRAVEPLKRTGASVDLPERPEGLMSNLAWGAYQVIQGHSSP